MPKIRERIKAIYSNKKVPIGPTFLAKDYDNLAHLVHVHERDMKPFVEDLVTVSLYTREVIEFFNPYFRRDLALEYPSGAAVYLGDPQRSRKRPRPAEPGELSIRVHVKFDKTDADRIKDFAYAMDCTPSSAVNLLVWKAIRTDDVVQRVLSRHSNKHGDTRANELKRATERRLAALAEANRPAKKRRVNRDLTL